MSALHRHLHPKTLAGATERTTTPQSHTAYIFDEEIQGGMPPISPHCLPTHQNAINAYMPVSEIDTECPVSALGFAPTIGGATL